MRTEATEPLRRRELRSEETSSSSPSTSTATELSTVALATVDPYPDGYELAGGSRSSASLARGEVVEVPKWPQAVANGDLAQAAANDEGDRVDQALDALQTGLDLVGLIPGLGEGADFANAGIALARGKPLEAALSLISMVPGVGDALGKGAKLALKTGDTALARKALDLLQKVDLDPLMRAAREKLGAAGDQLAKAVDDLAAQLDRIAGGGRTQLATPDGMVLESRRQAPGRAASTSGSTSTPVRPGKTSSTGQGDLTGTETEIPAGADRATAQSLRAEKATAETLARNGYQVERNPALSAEQMRSLGLDPRRNPDLLINGRVFDVFTPQPGANGRSIAGVIQEKVMDKAQTRRVVVNLDVSDANPTKVLQELKQEIAERRAAGKLHDLEEVMVVADGKVFPVFPHRR